MEHMFHIDKAVANHSVYTEVSVLLHYPNGKAVKGQVIHAPRR